MKSVVYQCPLKDSLRPVPELHGADTSTSALDEARTLYWKISPVTAIVPDEYGGTEGAGRSRADKHPWFMEHMDRVASG